MNSIIIDDEEYSYIITYKNIKNIYLRIRKEYLIEVSANKFTSKKEIEKLIREHERFIVSSNNKLKIIHNRPKKIMYLGKELSLILSNDTYIDNNYIYAKDEESAIKYIYSLSYDIFKRELDKIMIMFDDLPEFTLKVRWMKTKWGVCNKKSKTVTLNTELITKDISLIDYVIVHELCHFKHMDHSKEFWDEVSKYYPYYKHARKELNKI